ncbi:hypothetical protein [Methylosinus sp. LW3]|uniref:hypothetical protein n=1 Tax=Methylosinus sp. LW3 TaxID=107635 RepID=UPI000464AC5D|nr:hypothetical protein [Methylosinus sp. LW3]
MNIAATSTCSIPSSALASDYEVLRAAALGEALPLMARSGLMLFLRRGMWGWAKALTAAADPTPEPIDRRPFVSSRPGGYGAVVHVLATIAAGTNHAGLHEGIFP